MISMKDAKQMMNYYGFVSNSIEPMLCQYKKQVGIFATFKTKYGHLSRFVPFERKKNMEEFLKIYLWYRSKISDSKMIVNFDDYKNLTPKIEFEYNNEILNSTNLHEIELKNSSIEELIVDLSFEDSMAKIRIILDKIEETYKEIEEIENKYAKIIENYKLKMKEYCELIKINYENTSINYSKFDKNISVNKVKDIIEKLPKNLKENFNEYCKELLRILESIMLDSNYLNNIYLNDYYSEEIKILDLKIKKYQEYLEMSDNQKNKIFKNKKNKIDFDTYLKDNPIVRNNIDKYMIIENKKNQTSIIIEKLKEEVTNNIEEDFNNNKSFKVELDEFKIKDLNNYFMSLNIKERNKILLMFSPVKELINLVISIKENNKAKIINEEKYYLEKFKDIYEIISNQNNYASTRKYLKQLKLDSLEEFIDNIVEISNNLNMQPFVLNENIELKYKMGVILKEGYVNASIKDFYPINNKGANNYYISNVLGTIKVYYSPYVIKIDNDNNLVAEENNCIITFDMNNLNVSKITEILVKDYTVKKTKNEEFNFPVFNEKNYIISNITNN